MEIEIHFTPASRSNESKEPNGSSAGRNHNNQHTIGGPSAFASLTRQQNCRCATALGAHQ